MILDRAGVLIASWQFTVDTRRHPLHQPPDLSRAVAVQARLPDCLGSDTNQDPGHQCLPGAVEFPALSAARWTLSQSGPACSSHDHTVTAPRGYAHIRAVYRGGIYARNQSRLTHVGEPRTEG